MKVAEAMKGMAVMKSKRSHPDVLRLWMQSGSPLARGS
jgi:hypothetical protein